MGCDLGWRVQGLGLRVSDLGFGAFWIRATGLRSRA